MKESRRQDICGRIGAIRKDVCGPRGKSAFAKLLSLSPSTYDYYETSRVPPADVLVAISDIGGVDLRWLITGQSTGAEVPKRLHPVVCRAAQLLADRPDAADALGAFLDILAESAKFLTADKRAATPSWQPDKPAARRDSWIPILGRSAAGVAHFWPTPADADGVVPLMDVVGRYADRNDFRAQAARVEAPGADDDTVQIVTLDEPQQDETVEFVAAPAIKARWADAFAIRIDGDSMAPDIRHGDLVLLSPSEPAIDGRPAVVQLAGQIGVTCKLYRRAASRVHLVPINEHFPPQSFPAESVEWALRVLGKVRPQ